MDVSHSARLSPLQGETVWTLEGEEIIERRGGRERRFSLSRLKSLQTAKGGAILIFARGRMTIPALSYGEGLRPKDRSASFNAFLAAVAGKAAATSPRARFRSAGDAVAGPLIWTMCLLGAGAAALLLFAATAGAWSLGVALAARLVFVLILAAGVLPWLDRRDAKMDAN